MDRTPDADSCARLKCIADLRDDKNSVQSITALRIYKISVTHKLLFKQASMLLLDPSPHLEMARGHVINATGQVTRFHGYLMLEFQDEFDCLYGSFLCELNFINTSGELVVVKEVVTPEGEKLGDVVFECSAQNYVCNSVLLSKMAATIETHSVDVAKDHSLFSNQTRSIEAKLDSLLLRLQTLEELHNDCYKGMSKKVARLKILLWNNVEALCEAHTDGGGWIIFQRRTKGDVSFSRNWTDYTTGFGTSDADYWLGNDLIHNLTSIGYNELRVDLKKGLRTYFACYSNFSVADATLNYQLTVSGYSGTAGDALIPHNLMYFSTSDKDNDKHGTNCASYFAGGWWYSGCYQSHLNGLFGAQNTSGINWQPLLMKTSADFTEMKIRQG
ncbi:unnamed protein product [Candidula unifasciata]|uniref:Fibrinogen C-terminal domain-containing protein n=1 Tax=Candidula unifasciata TaxID=100452 RepID=A0A8S3YLD9_9EUPU|nr:unnamed protein product [Candidula unifasciata]